jgi:hypothetical protein
VNPDEFRWTDKNCRFYATCVIDPCGGVRTCPDGYELPLFVPLAKRWYLDFKAGSKRTEFRPAGILIDKRGKEHQSPWNARTCRVGRAALLSNGYQVAGRLEAVVEAFVEQTDAGSTTAAFDEIYPGHRERGGLVAAITFRTLA